MTGPIAQIVALTCYGNAFLEGSPVPGFFPANSTCQFCERVTFVETVKPLIGWRREVEVAKNPDEWFSYLEKRGALGIRLACQARNDPQISDRMSAGFVGGGGDWILEVLLPNERSEFWSARWEVVNQEAPDRRIWRVTYARISEAKSKPDAERDPARFLEALREIHAFSAKHDGGHFTECFSRAIATLTGAEPHGYHRDIAPPGLLPPGAGAVLDAAQSAWVFGGMGSWNDMSFDGSDPKEYNRVSEQLFQALTQAICEAANAGCKKGGPPR